MDIVLKHGHIYDGTGKEPYYGDIRIADGTITEMGEDLSSSGEVIDAEGLAISPGFIDEHTHTDRTIFEVPSSASKITQGVTSEMTGNCGIGPFPVTGEHKEELLAYLDALYSSSEPYPLRWHDFSGFAQAVEAVHPAVNMLPLLAHGALRMSVMGTAERKASEKEMEQMKARLVAELEQGAWGMSTGLVYPPGSFADTQELEELAHILAAYGSIFTSHVRGESGTLLQADEEIIGIGKRSGCDVIISHLKAIGKAYWGDGCKALKLIEKARTEGQIVWADQYPYEATNTALSVLAPEWAHDGGIEGLMHRLTDPETRPRLMADMRERMEVRGGAACVQISNIHTQEGRKYLGMTLEAIAQKEGKQPEEAAADILLQERGAVSATYFSLGKADVETIIQSPIVAVCSDGYGLDIHHHAQSVHPRAYGTFTRVLGRYVREKKLLSLQTAIWKMTGLPATAFRIPKRGFLKEGYAADITVFDPNTVRDKATFSEPHQYSEGIEYVFVNGVLSVRQGHLTGNCAGQVLRRGK